MSPEEREMLEKSLALAEENNKMLHSMKRSMMWARVMRIVYWTILLGSAVGAYYFIQPYVDQIIGVYGDTKDSFEGINTLFQNINK